MSIRGAHQRATTALALSGHAFGGSPHASGLGIPLGCYVDNNQQFCFDPFVEKAYGTFSSTAGMVIGPKGSGKSVLFKVLGMRLMMTSAGYRFMTIAVNDFKPETANSEYDRFGRYLGCDTYDIATRSVNPFESTLGLGELSVLEMATLLCDHESNNRLAGRNFEALKIAVFKMLQGPEILWTIQQLLKVSLSLKIEDINTYYADMHNRMRGQLEARVNGFTNQVAEREQYLTQVVSIYERGDNLDVAGLMESGVAIAQMLSSLLEGRYGKMLGGGDSLYEMLSKRAVVKDWRGVSKESMALMRAIDIRIQINAIERGLLHLYPRIELDDEDHQAMKNLRYAEGKALKTKILRSAQMFSFSGTQRLGDYRMGGAGSELAALGQSIIDDTAFFFVASQESATKGDLDELQERLGISNLDRTKLTRLPKHVLAFKAGPAEPLKFIKVLPSAVEDQLIPSDGASDAIVDRSGLRPASYGRVADETGYALKGVEA